MRLRQAPEVRAVEFAGIERAQATPEVREAFRTADAIVVAPSNPIVSIGPILAVPGMLAEIGAARRRGVRAVGVSGIVGGKALRGPADRMLVGLGEEASALDVARRYASAELLDTFVIDTLDEPLTAEVRALGLQVVVTDTVMADAAGRVRLALDILAAAAGSPA